VLQLLRRELKRGNDSRRQLDAIRTCQCARDERMLEWRVEVSDALCEALGKEWRVSRTVFRHAVSLGLGCLDLERECQLSAAVAMLGRHIEKRCAITLTCASCTACATASHVLPW
jgi:hypothetical protein